MSPPADSVRTQYAHVGSTPMPPGTVTGLPSAKRSMCDWKRTCVSGACEHPIPSGRTPSPTPLKNGAAGRWGSLLAGTTGPGWLAPLETVWREASSTTSTGTPTSTTIADTITSERVEVPGPVLWRGLRDLRDERGMATARARG